MKKILILLTISSLGFIACNNSANNKNAEDSTAVSEDTFPADSSMETTPANPDTVVNLDTTAGVTDSAAH